MSKVDWSKAPEDAEFYACERFYFRFDCNFLFFFHCENGAWCESGESFSKLTRHNSYEERPKEEKPSDDCVKSPDHYQLMDGIESIEIIARSMTKEQWKGFCLGNMLKYRIRAGKKGELQQDIDKADFYGELYEMHKGKCYE